MRNHSLRSRKSSLRGSARTDVSESTPANLETSQAPRPISARAPRLAVRRDEIVDYQTWASEVRASLEEHVLATKQDRHIHVGEDMTFLFENADTVRWQVQEMMRVEEIVKESAIQHELDTYNELLGRDGELGAVLLIEIDDPAVRAQRLTAWRGMPGTWYVGLEDGRRARATMDSRQVDDTRLSAVQYLRFDTGGAVPVSVGCDYPGYMRETRLNERQRAALAEDLGSVGA